MSGLFSSVETMGHEQVVYCYDKKSGLKAIIGIHDTTLGPALGGTRLWFYENEDQALKDVLRLSRGMTYKAACAGLNLGGGKAVIIAKPEQKTEAMFRSFGRFVQSLGGRYITAEDVNTCVTDMNHVRMETRYVTGVSPELGGSGDPSPVTALGVFCGLKTAVQHKLGRADLRGLKVAVQGIGNVGRYLCQYLHEEGAQLFVSDLSKERCSEMERTYAAKIASTEDIMGLDVDVFAPCALGGILNSASIPKLKAKIVAGGANNQLEDEVAHSIMLTEHGIAYCPDYVLNAGGLINVYNELLGYNREKALAEARHIGVSIATILADAEKEGITTHAASQRLAERRIQGIKDLKPMHNLESSCLAKLNS
jgi:leucine dehydrogenase